MKFENYLFNFLNFKSVKMLMLLQECIKSVPVNYSIIVLP